MFYEGNIIIMLIVLILRFVFSKLVSVYVYVCYLLIIGLIFFWFVFSGSFIVCFVLFDLILNNYCVFWLFVFEMIFILKCIIFWDNMCDVLKFMLFVVKKFIIVGWVLIWNLVIELWVLLFVFIVGVLLV